MIVDISAPVPMRALLNRRGRNQALVRADPVVRNGITPSASQQAAGAMAEGLNNVGTNLLNKNLSIQPTLNIRPGYAFNVLVNRTMILPPYSGR
jgi:type IV secretory pathway VirB10-like protein